MEVLVVFTIVVEVQVQVEVEVAVMIPVVVLLRSPRFRGWYVDPDSLSKLYAYLYNWAMFLTATFSTLF